MPRDSTDIADVPRRTGFTSTNRRRRPHFAVTLSGRGARKRYGITGVLGAGGFARRPMRHIVAAYERGYATAEIDEPQRQAGARNVLGRFFAIARGEAESYPAAEGSRPVALKEVLGFEP